MNKEVFCMSEKYRKINARVLKEQADIPAVLGALGLPWKPYRDKIYCLNVWRNDKQLGSAYFQPGKNGGYYFVDWADTECNGRDIIDYVREERGYSFPEACDFVSQISGFDVEDVEEEVDGEAEAKKAEIAAKREQALKVASLLGLDGSAECYPQYQGDEWMDKDILAVYPDCDYDIAKQAAQGSGAKVLKITEYDFWMVKAFYPSPKFTENFRKYLELVATGKMPERPYYVVYKEFPDITLATLMGEDPETYKDFIAMKKREKLADIRAERKWLDDNVFDDDEYDYRSKILDSLEKEVKEIDVE